MSASLRNTTLTKPSKERPTNSTFSLLLGPPGDLTEPPTEGEASPAFRVGPGEGGADNEDDEDEDEEDDEGGPEVVELSQIRCIS